MSERALESALIGAGKDFLRMHPVGVQMSVGRGKLKQIRTLQAKYRQHRYEASVLQRGGTVSFTGDK